MKVTDHPYVDSYWVEELPNGVIHLLINCKQKEIYYHAYSDNDYFICGTPEEYDDADSRFILPIGNFLLKDTTYQYIQTSMKVKDQISYYYIPYQKDWIKNKKFIIE